MSRVAPPGPEFADDVLVVKFGGTCLAEGRGVERAAELVLSHAARRKLVVVSAPGETTDRLVSLVEGVSRSLDDWEVARLLSLGERISARLLASVLQAHGAAARALEPEDDAWPVATQGGPLGARVDLETSRGWVRERLVPLLEHEIVVVCGFLGREGERPTTLRRGGSDTTAVALARLLRAREVLMAKDVPGILRSDPRQDGPTGSLALPLDRLSASQALALAEGGARVVSPEALSLLGDGLHLRVVPFQGSLSPSEGTVVVADPDRAEAGPAEERGVASVVALVDDGAGLESVSRAIPQGQWHGISAVPGAVTVFVDEEQLPPLLLRLRAIPSVRAVTARRGLSRLAVPRGAIADRTRIGPVAGRSPLEDPDRLVGAVRADGQLRLFVVPEAGLRNSAGTRIPPAPSGGP